MLTPVLGDGSGCLRSSAAQAREITTAIAIVYWTGPVVIASAASATVQEGQALTARAWAVVGKTGSARRATVADQFFTGLIGQFGLLVERGRLPPGAWG